MIKKEIIIPLMKVEDQAASNLRRESYALKRDLQNTKINEAIAARLLRTDKMTKCEKCGIHFTNKTSESLLRCPQCR